MLHDVVKLFFISIPYIIFGFLFVYVSARVVRTVVLIVLCSLEYKKPRKVNDDQRGKKKSITWPRTRFALNKPK